MRVTTYINTFTFYAPINGIYWGRHVKRKGAASYVVYMRWSIVPIAARIPP